MIKNLRILSIIMAAITLLALFLTLSTCFDEVTGWADAFMIICLFIDASLTAGCIGQLTEMQRTEKIIENMKALANNLDEIIEKTEKERASRSITVDRERVVEIGAAVSVSMIDIISAEKKLCEELGREALKAARVRCAEITGGPLDDPQKYYEAVLRVVPFNDGGFPHEE